MNYEQEFYKSNKAWHELEKENQKLKAALDCAVVTLERYKKWDRVNNNLPKEAHLAIQKIDSILKGDK